ncbi:MAG TPA: O-antigen ligase family protein [Vicinamibacteria bacterium]|nr:O-antigen ligase family protein [Vicinamibacteria bacterium]
MVLSAALAAGAFVGSAIVSASLLVVFFLIGSVVVLLIAGRPLWALSLLVVLLPFSGTDPFRVNLAGFSGTKLLNLLMVLVVFVSVINWKKGTKLPTYATGLAFAWAAVFSVAVFRSLANLETINYYVLEPLSPSEHILTHLVKPFVYFLPLVIVARFIRTRKDAEFLTTAVTLAVGSLGAFVLYVYFFMAGPGAEAKVINDNYMSTLGLHRNGLVTFPIIGIPIILARWFRTRDTLSAVCFVLGIASVGTLLSRTGYLSVPIGVVGYLALSKRVRYVPLIAAAIAVVTFFAWSQIAERLNYRLESGDRNAVSAGRIDTLWIPLLEEAAADPEKLFLGNGRFATGASQMAERGAILDVRHPHNMFVELLLDAGVVGFTILMAFLFVVLWKLKQSLQISTDPAMAEHLRGALVALGSYLVAGLTGRSLFPQLGNSFFWIVLGLAIALIGLAAAESRSTPRETEAHEPG